MSLTSNRKIYISNKQAYYNLLKSDISNVLKPDNNDNNKQMVGGSSIPNDNDSNKEFQIRSIISPNIMYFSQGMRGGGCSDSDDDGGTCGGKSYE